MSLRFKIPIWIGLSSFIYFVIQFLFLEFAFEHWRNPKGENTLNFQLLGFYSSFLLSVIAGFTSYYLLGFLYQLLNQMVLHIQEDQTPKEIQKLKNDSEEYKIYRAIKFVMMDSSSHVEDGQFENKFDWIANKANSVIKLIPDLDIPKIPGFDIAVFPSGMRYAGADYIRVLKAKDGLFGILSGHIEPGVTESAEKLFIHGIVSSLNPESQTVTELMERFESHLHQISFSELKISLFGLTYGTDQLSLLHCMDMPVFQFSNHGIQVIEGGGDDKWYPGHDHQLAIADGIEVGDYLVWASDKTLSEFGLTSFEIMEEFVDYLLDLKPKSSREMLLAIAKKMSSLGKERLHANPLEKLSIVVIKKTK
ncbi:Arg-Lys translocation region protein phosphatase [Leptospira sp. 96542]|nr:Arg-Lys translocation region protein phosphatase [Leptospira sp. 96542]